MAGGEVASIVVTDANVVINFIHVGLLGDLPRLVGLSFVVTDVVYEEVSRPEQRAALDAALAAGMWKRESLVELEAIALQAELMTIMDPGEAATLALAATKGYLVASDERRAFLREARARLGTGRIVDTPGLIVLAIRAGTLTVAHADELKAVLEGHRFSMRFRSFADLVQSR
jgi:predicted nucleic acid-binding protein